MNLNSLANYIRRNKKYNCWVSAKTDGILFTIEDYAFDNLTKTLYLFCDSSFNHSIKTNDILRLDNIYSTLNLMLVCAEFNKVVDVKGVYTERGWEGEKDSVVVY